MSVKIVLVFCAQALLIQCAFSQCIGRGAIDSAYGWTGPGIAPIAYDGIAYDGVAYDGLGWTSPAAVYDAIPAPFACDGYTTPYGYDYGWTGPALAPIYDGYYNYGYDGYFTPYGYDGLGWTGRSLAYEGYPAYSYGSSGGSSFKVTSVSPIRPTGISIVSENTFEGPLTVFGEMPFLAVVSLDGVLPTLGAGAINHACGNGVSAIVSEGIAPPPYAYGPGPYAGIGYGIPACGCGLY